MPLALRVCFTVAAICGLAPAHKHIHYKGAACADITCAENGKCHGGVYYGNDGAEACHAHCRAVGCTCIDFAAGPSLAPIRRHHTCSMSNRTSRVVVLPAGSLRVAVTTPPTDYIRDAPRGHVHALQVKYVGATGLAKETEGRAGAWAPCAEDGSWCDVACPATRGKAGACTEDGWVRYGGGESWATARVPAGSKLHCTADVFGDVAARVKKGCHVFVAAAPPGALAEGTVEHEQRDQDVLALPAPRRPSELGHVSADTWARRCAGAQVKQMIAAVDAPCAKVKAHPPHHTKFPWHMVLTPIHVPPPTPAAQKLRILCLVVSDEKEHCSRAQGAAWTYTKKCDRVAYMSSKDDQELLPGSVNLPHKGSEAYGNLWTKTKSMFMYAYDHRDLFDWVLIVDSDAYIVMENLRAQLADLDRGPDPAILNDPEQGRYIGAPVGGGGDRFQPVKNPKAGAEKTYDALAKHMYNQGGAVALDRKAVVKLAAARDSDRCQDSTTSAEDMRLGKCLKSVGILPVDSRDRNGWLRWHPHPPVYKPATAKPLKNAWHMGEFKAYEHVGQSNESVSWHKVSAKDMFIIDRLLYGCKD